MTPGGEGDWGNCSYCDAPLLDDHISGLAHTGLERATCSNCMWRRGSVAQAETLFSLDGEAIQGPWWDHFDMGAVVALVDGSETDRTGVIEGELVQTKVSTLGDHPPAYVSGASASAHLFKGGRWLFALSIDGLLTPNVPELRRRAVAEALTLRWHIDTDVEFQFWTNGRLGRYRLLSDSESGSPELLTW